MASHDEIAARWIQTLAGDTDSRGRYLENFAGRRQNMYAHGRTIYSYGTHFPLAEYYAGRRRSRPLFLLNGDRVSNTTSRHQSAVLSAVRHGARRLDAETLLLPFSALDAARVDRSSIRPLEIRADEWLELEESAETLEAVPNVYRTWTEWQTADTLEGVPADVAARGWNQSQWQGQYRSTSTGRYHWPVVHTIQPAADGRYHWTRKVHRLGDSVFTAETSETRRRSRDWTVLDVIGETLEYLSAERFELERPQDRYYGVSRRQDRDSLPTTAGRRLERLELSPIVETETLRRRRRYVSSFDTNEPIPAYFLATLPTASRAATVDAAIMDLAPAAVHAAILRGRDVRRQGDVFFIGTDLADVDVYSGARSRARLTQWSRGAAAKLGETGYLRPISAARWRRIRRDARRLYLERLAADGDRPGPTSPRGIRNKARRARAGRDASLRAYRRDARAAILRGDMETLRRVRGRNEYLLAHGPMDTRTAERDKYRRASLGGLGVARDRMADSFGAAYRRHSGRLELAERRQILRTALTVHGTAHTATEVVKRPDGRTYVRGIVRHVPELAGENRGRDHVNVRLERGRWYLAVRNTVPRSRDTAGR